MAPNLVRFQTKDSPVGRISPAEASLMVSSISIGILFGTLFYGFLADRCGRKWPLLGIAVPQIAANAFLIVGTHPYFVYASRLLTGFACGGVLNVLPNFVSEISQER